MFRFLVNSNDDVKKIEDTANSIIGKSIPVKIENFDRGTAEQKYGFRIYQGGVVPVKSVRIVSIGDLDIEACGGTHVVNTSDIEQIKITKTKRIQDGVVRIEFVSGDSAKEFVKKKKQDSESKEKEVKLKEQERLFKNKIKEEILIPLELNDTYSLLSEINLDDLTSGYHIGWDMDVKQNNYIIPGGSMIATIKDVGVFLRALIDGSLLNKQEQEIYSSIYKYEHTGLLPGYQSIARYNEDIDAVVILFINTSGNSWSKTESVYKKIVKAIKRES